MTIKLAPKPGFGDTKIESGFSFLPKVIECGNLRLWIWLEFYTILWNYNSCDSKWSVEEYAVGKENGKRLNDLICF